MLLICAQLLHSYTYYFKFAPTTNCRLSDNFYLENLILRQIFQVNMMCELVHKLADEARNAILYSFGTKKINELQVRP
jgi:hypothetical protein